MSVSCYVCGGGGWANNPKIFKFTPPSTVQTIHANPLYTGTRHFQSIHVLAEDKMVAVGGERNGSTIVSVCDGGVWDDYFSTETIQRPLDVVWRKDGEIWTTGNHPAAGQDGVWKYTPGSHTFSQVKSLPNVSYYLSPRDNDDEMIVGYANDSYRWAAPSWVFSDSPSYASPKSITQFPFGIYYGCYYGFVYKWAGGTSWSLVCQIGGGWLYNNPMVQGIWGDAPDNMFFFARKPSTPYSFQCWHWDGSIVSLRGEDAGGLGGDIMSQAYRIFVERDGTGRFWATAVNSDNGGLTWWSDDDGVTWSRYRWWDWTYVSGMSILEVPELYPIDPVDSEMGVGRGDSWTLDLIGGEQASSEIKATIHGGDQEDVWLAGSPQSGYSVVESPVAGGYRYVITPDEDQLPLTEVEIYANILSTSGVPVPAADQTYSFVIEDFAVDAGQSSQLGGDALVITRRFTASQSLEVQIGGTGVGDGEPCFAGRGDAYTVVSEDGLTVEIILPPAAARTNETIWARPVGGSWTAIAFVDLIERGFAGILHHIRRSFPAWYALGARRLEAEPELNVAAANGTSTFGTSTYGTGTYGG